MINRKAHLAAGALIGAALLGVNGTAGAQVSTPEAPVEQPAAQAPAAPDTQYAAPEAPAEVPPAPAEPPVEPPAAPDGQYAAPEAPEVEPPATEQPEVQPPPAAPPVDQYADETTGLNEATNGETTGASVSVQAEARVFAQAENYEECKAAYRRAEEVRFEVTEVQAAAEAEATAGGSGAFAEARVEALADAYSESQADEDCRADDEVEAEARADARAEVSEFYAGYEGYDDGRRDYVYRKFYDDYAPRDPRAYEECKIAADREAEAALYGQEEAAANAEATAGAEATGGAEATANVEANTEVRTSVYEDHRAAYEECRGEDGGESTGAETTGTDTAAEGEAGGGFFSGIRNFFRGLF